VMGTNYITLKVDGAVAQYVPYNTDSKVIDFTKTSHKGGTGYIFTVPTTGSVTFVDGTTQTVKTHVKYDTAVKAIKMISSVALETGYVNVTGGPSGASGAQKYNTALTLNGNASDTYSYEVSGQTKYVGGKGTIPATDMVADITLNSVSGSVIRVDDQTFTDASSAKAYVASKSNVGTGLWKDAATIGTVEDNEYQTYAAFAADPSVATSSTAVYHTGYVKKTGTGISNNMAMKVGETDKITAAANSTGYAYQESGKAEVYRPYSQSITVPGVDYVVTTGKITVIIDGKASNKAVDPNNTWTPSDFEITYSPNYDVTYTDVTTGLAMTIEMTASTTPIKTGTADVVVTYVNKVTSKPSDGADLKDIFGIGDDKQPTKPGMAIGSKEEIEQGTNANDITPGDNMYITIEAKDGYFYGILFYRGSTAVGTPLNENSNNMFAYDGANAGSPPSASSSPTYSTGLATGIFCLNGTSGQDDANNLRLTAGTYCYQIVILKAEGGNLVQVGTRPAVVFEFTPSDLSNI